MTPYPNLPSAGARHLFVVREEAAPYGASDEDALESLGDEISTLAAHIHAATHRLLVLLAEFDERRGWERDGHPSCAHWLAFRTGIDLGAAREKVRAARALTSLPLTSAAMARGELSFSQVRALTRVATAETEGDLVELARGCTTAQLERVVRATKRGSRRDEADLDRERRERRVRSTHPHARPAARRRPRAARRARNGSGVRGGNGFAWHGERHPRRAVSGGPPRGR